MKMQRMARCIRIRPDKVEEYKRLHAAVWPAVLARITACHIRNYTIFLREPENILFAYWEYHGSDFRADMAAMAADAKTQEWWRLTDPCQRRMESSPPGEWWAPMEDVFHHG
jgi:L-rhamnose mutarotase